MSAADHPVMMMLGYTVLSLLMLGLCILVSGKDGAP